MYAPSDRTRRRARRMRASPTYAEAAFWELVCDRRVSGLKFLRQAPVGEMVVDFLCREHRLVVELDGGIHELRKSEGAERDALPASRGCRTVRFRNEDVLREPDRVLDAIRQACGLPLQFPGSFVLARLR